MVHPEIGFMTFQKRTNKVNKTRPNSAMHKNKLPHTLTLARRKTRLQEKHYHRAPQRPRGIPKNKKNSKDTLL
jgi:hypothetical protein